MFFKMKTFVWLLYAIAFSKNLVAASSIPRPFRHFPTTRRYLNATQVQRELGNQVSNTTVVFGPDDSRYKNSTARWSIYERPRIQVVIEPALADDVSIIVNTMSITISSFQADSC